MQTHLGEDDRTALEKHRRIDLERHARNNGLDVSPYATKGQIISIMEGRGLRPPVAVVGSRFSKKEDVEAAKGELADMIETMRPSELRALGKQFNIEINIRMTPEEVSIAKKQLIEKM